MEIGKYCDISDDFVGGPNFLCGQSVRIDKDVVVGNDVKVGNFVVIHEGARIGDNVTIDDFVVLKPGVSLGKGVVVEDHSLILSDSRVEAKTKLGTHTKVGRNVKIGEGCKFTAFCEIRDNCQVGNNVSMGSRCTLSAGWHVEDDVIMKYSFVATDTPVVGQESVKRVGTLKRGSRFGANVTIMPGLTMGENSEIGACSQVRTDVPDNEVWYGNPAKFFRKRK